MVAVIAVPLSRALGLGAILGYLAAGGHGDRALAGGQDDITHSDGLVEQGAAGEVLAVGVVDAVQAADLGRLGVERAGDPRARVVLVRGIDVSARKDARTGEVARRLVTADDEHLEPKFELPIPVGPNLVTRNGLAQTATRVAEPNTIRLAVFNSTRTCPPPASLPISVPE